MNLRKFAKGKPCFVRIPGVCNHNPETTVLAHFGGAGMGKKHHDFIACWCCSECHDLADGRKQLQWKHTDDLIMKYFLEGIIRTQQELLRAGLDKVIDDWAKGLEP